MRPRLLLFALAVLAVAQDPATLARYAGAYSAQGSAPTLVLTVENDHLAIQLGNQQPRVLHVESQTVFSIPNGPKIEFAGADAQGRAAEAILHLGPRDQSFKRLDDAAAKPVLDAAADFIRRFRNQIPAPGGDQVVRAAIAGLQSGKLDYTRMSPGLAEVTRQQLPNLQATFTKLGALQSVAFKSVGPGGADVYLCRFEKGAIEYRIWLATDGKVESANFTPVNLAVSGESLRPHFAEIDSLISAELARRPVGSVTAGIVAGKDLVWSKSYGLADMEKKTAADTDTVYRIGSITKMFTAVMLDQLIEAGKVHLSDPVQKYFPEINAVQGRYADAPPVTLIELATHTSGLGREPDQAETYTTGSVANWKKTLIAALPHTHYTLEPGTRYSYSNIGYAILGAALSRAAGETYTDYVPKHIFLPLGMTHSALESNPQIAAHLSKGYQLMGPNGEVDSETPQRETETGRGYKVPNGAIFTTVGDLAHFASLMVGEGPDTVLKPATLNRIQNETIVPADSQLRAGYGIGFSVDRRDDYVAFGHDGAVAGYTAALLMNQKIKVGVVVLSNGAANPGSIAERALDILSK
jgi:CubicO group peptidase (beta-lactamase class C family)